MPSTDDHMLADLRRQAETMTGPEALPRRNDEPVFDEPWQGRAVAVAVETVAGLGESWEAFRTLLIAAIDDDPSRDYYESWLIALERLVIGRELTAASDLDAARMAAASYRTTEQEDGDLEVFPIEVTEERVVGLLTWLLSEHWRELTFGPDLPGAVFALRACRRPVVTALDGYLRVDMGQSRFHLCVGEQHGVGAHPVDSTLARRRRCSHVELQRQWVGGAPQAWMVRLFNGEGDQMITVSLPHPFLDDDHHATDRADWSRLDVWDELRRRYLDLPADPADRLATAFVHA